MNCHSRCIDYDLQWCSAAITHQRTYKQSTWRNGYDVVDMKERGGGIGRGSSLATVYVKLSAQRNETEMKLFWNCFVSVSFRCADSLRKQMSYLWIAKKMAVLCINEFTAIDMLVNDKKCHVIQFGCRYLSPWIQVSVQNNLVDCAEKVKYLRVTLRGLSRFPSMSISRRPNCVQRLIAYFTELANWKMN